MFRCFLFIVVLTVGSEVSAQEAYQLDCLGPDCKKPADTKESAAVPFGTYSYRHSYLHELGVIERLMQRADKSCCDSGIGGECRVTVLSADGKYFKHGDIWCPLSTGQIIYTDVGLPPDVQAVVCAGRTDPDTCPVMTYCVGASFAG